MTDLHVTNKEKDHTQAAISHCQSNTECGNRCDWNYWPYKQGKRPHTGRDYPTVSVNQTQSVGTYECTEFIGGSAGMVNVSSASKKKVL